MAKLTRVFQKVFGSAATAGQIGKFGSCAAGTPEAATDPVEVQELANYLEGWFGAVLANNSPAIEDMNALCYLYAYQLAQIFQSGIAEWDVETPYYIGSFCSVAGKVYVSSVDDNVGNLVTDSTKWRVLGERTITAFSADHTILITDDVVEFDATAADRACTVPAASLVFKGKSVTIVKMDNSANIVSISDGTLALQLNGQYDSETIFCNGTVWYAI